MLLSALLIAATSVGIPTESFRKADSDDEVANIEDVKLFVDLSQQHADGKAMNVAFDALSQGFDKMARDMAKMKEELDSVTAERDAFKAKAEEDAKIDSVPLAMRNEWARKRRDALDLAAEYDVEIENADSLDIDAIRLKVAQSLVDNVADNADSAYVDAVLDLRKKMQPKQDSAPQTFDPYAATFAKRDTARTDSKVTDGPSPTEASMNALRGNRS